MTRREPTRRARNKTSVRPVACNCARRKHASFTFIANTAPGHFASIAIQPSYRGLAVSVWAPTARRTREQIAIEESLQRCVEAVLQFAKKDSAEFVLNAATAAGFSQVSAFGSTTASCL